MKFHPHLHNNNHTCPCSHCMPGWLQLKAAAAAATTMRVETEQSAETHWWPCGSERRDVESRCLPCAHWERRGRGIDRTSAEWISGQMLYKHVITCSVSHSPSTPLTILACQFVIRTQQNDSAPADLRGRGVGTQQDRLSGVLLIMLRHLNYVRVDTVSCKVYNMSKLGS